MEKVKLTYFKQSGKYYSEGEYESDKMFYDVVGEVRTMKKEGNLPGLVEGATEFSVVLEYQGVPYLIV